MSHTVDTTDDRPLLGYRSILALAALLASSSWIAGAVVVIAATGDIVLQSDEQGAAEGTVLGGVSAAVQLEINEASKLYKPKYWRWDKLGTKGVGEWTLGFFALGYTGDQCRKSVFGWKPVGALAGT